MSVKRVRVVFCWTEASGYMAACWRALAAMPGVSLHILHSRGLTGQPANPFLEDLRLLDGVDNEVFDPERPDVDAHLLQRVTELQPDVLVVSGWLYWPHVQVALSPAMSRVPLVIGMDSPWRGTWRQRLAPLRLRTFIRRAALVVCAGERSREYARRLGVPEQRIKLGYYGYDHARFQAAAEQRAGSAWPRQFLYVGRYVPPKDLPTLVDAYRSYRASVSDPWGLTCRGAGPEAGLLADCEGVIDDGFAHPRDLPEVFARHGAFVIASKFEPWGVVIGEAAASGLPVLCTTACGAADDLVRECFNGLTVAPGDAHGLAQAMRWIHDHERDLPALGRHSQLLSEAFSAESWAVRWRHYLALAAGR